MIKKKESVAMLLAGGQGSRLYLLTERTAKPAVTYGGKYKIIDFPISNCVNSGIETVGVLTQYQPLALNEYIGNGQPWDLDRSFGGIMVLPPYQGNKRSDWYKGTANAIYQNINFISRYDPDYVVILSGDHIYKMNYDDMLTQHKKSESDCTIAVINVPKSEASRFGIMSVDNSGRIFKFEEKPKKTDSTLASMGIYIFNKSKLFAYLEQDEQDPESENDFGKNIIPKMLSRGERLYAYPFEGYWKDVGTLSSLWESNMDLLGERPALNLIDNTWKIYSRNLSKPPHYAGENAVIGNSLITEGCEIYGTVINSVLSAGVVVERGAVIRDSVVHEDVRICEKAYIDYSIIDSETTIGKSCRIGVRKNDSKGLTLIGGNLSIPDGSVIKDAERVDAEFIKEIVGANNKTVPGDKKQKRGDKK